MKLLGTKKKGKHLKKGRGKAVTTENNKPVKKRKINLGLKIAVGILVAVTALGLSALAYLKLSAEPPPVRDTPATPSGLPKEVEVDKNNDDESPEVESTGIRDMKKYTILVLGTDDGNGNTDVIMLATLDTRDYSLNVVNIPRDTLVNVSWSTKKANSIYSGMKEKGTEEDEMAGVREKFAALVGYEVDFYVVVDLEAFSAIVDAVGGVYYDVPRNMKYDDPAQNFHVNIVKGPQTLSGKQALQVVRWRQNNDGSGYATGDIGRIETTQDFLMTAAKQILENKSSISITSVASIFLKYVKTDLKLNHLIWFAQELFKLNAEDISFELMPGNYNDSIRRSSNAKPDSYVTIYVDEWLELINKKLNPFTIDITLDNLSIYTRGADKQLYVTNGAYAGNESWGRSSAASSSSGSSSGGSSTPKPTATPAPTVTPSTTPTTTPTATPTATQSPVPSDSQPETSPEGTEPETETTPSPAQTPDEEIIVPPPATPSDDDAGTLYYTGAF